MARSARLTPEAIFALFRANHGVEVMDQTTGHDPKRCGACVAFAEIDRLRLVELQAKFPWRNMEDAPRDGTKIDLLYPWPRGRTIDCFWRANLGGWFWREPVWRDGRLAPMRDWSYGSYPNMEPLYWVPAAPGIAAMPQIKDGTGDQDKELIDYVKICHDVVDGKATVNQARARLGLAPISGGDAQWVGMAERIGAAFRDAAEKLRISPIKNYLVGEGPQDYIEKLGLVFCQECDWSCDTKHWPGHATQMLNNHMMVAHRHVDPS